MEAGTLEPDGRDPTIDTSTSPNYQLLILNAAVVLACLWCNMFDSLHAHPYYLLVLQIDMFECLFEM